MTRDWRLVFLSLLLLSGCATIANGTKAHLNIRSVPEDAGFELRDYDGRVVAAGRTPAVATVARSRGPYRTARYDLVVTKEGYLSKRTRIQSRIDDLFWIDWILIVPGFFIDPFTGGMWNIIDPPVQTLVPEVPFGRPSAERSAPP